MIFIFFRDSGWYPIDRPSIDAAIADAFNNPGTRKVETVDGELIWIEQDGAMLKP